MSTRRVVVWLTEDTWPACVDVAAGLAGTPEVVLVHVVDSQIGEAAHGAFGGLLGRGSRQRDPGDTVISLARKASEQLLGDARLRLGRSARVESPTGRVEREVVAAAEGADLLVCARDGDRRRLGPRSLGRDTRFVVDHAPCAVLLIWPDAVPELVSIPPPPEHPTGQHPGPPDS